LATEAICNFGHTRAVGEHVVVELAKHVFGIVYMTVVRMDLVVGVTVSQLVLEICGWSLQCTFPWQEQYDEGWDLL
jgi:hypothetical protein